MFGADLAATDSDEDTDETIELVVSGEYVEDEVHLHSRGPPRSLIPVA